MRVGVAGLHVQHFQQCGRRFQALGGDAASGDFRPVVGTLGAALQDLEPDRAGLGGGGAPQHEFVVVVGGQGIVRAVGSPGDFQHAFGVFFAVAFIRRCQGADFGAQCPARFGHGLGAIESGRDGDAHGRGALTVTAVAHAKGGAVAGVGRSRAILQHHMGKTAARQTEQAGGREKTNGAWCHKYLA